MRGDRNWVMFPLNGFFRSSYPVIAIGGIFTWPSSQTRVPFLKARIYFFRIGNLPYQSWSIDFEWLFTIVRVWILCREDTRGTRMNEAPKIMIALLEKKKSLWGYRYLHLLKFREVPAWGEVRNARILRAGVHPRAHHLLEIKERARRIDALLMVLSGDWFHLLEKKSPRVTHWSVN